MDSSIIPAALGIASLVVVGLVFLFLRNRSDILPALHLVALAAALVGAFVVGMSFATDHPKKWVHLVIPFLFVVIVYGYALGTHRVTWDHLLQDIRSRIRRKNSI